MKEPESSIFSAESNDLKPLNRVVIPKNNNKIMRQISEQLSDNHTITNYNF